MIQLNFWPTLTFAVIVLSWLVFVLTFSFHRKPCVHEGHKLVTQGPYSVLRNPIYKRMFGMLPATGPRR
jgi:protein-S-isoprenylcysteine O-methyltransferase Ste14